MAADDRPRIRVAVRIDRFEEQREPAAVGLVLEALPALVLHDVALVVELFLRRRVEQRRQAVRFEPQEVLEVGRGHGREVVGAVVAGRAVDAALSQVGARLLGVREVLAAGVLRALEHHVLEQVREAGAAGSSRSSTRRGTTGSRGRWAACGRRAGSPAGRWAACTSRTRLSESRPGCRPASARPGPARAPSGPARRRGVFAGCS